MVGSDRNCPKKTTYNQWNAIITIIPSIAIILTQMQDDKQTNKEYMAVRETYISRILSALSDGVAKVDEKIKEVISIWICIDARKNEDSIIEYQLRPEVKFGENIHPEEINLLKGILIKIRGGKNMTQSKNKLIEMLEYVIADHSAEEKRII